MRVLVTGAAGFIGSHLCERLLQDGADVSGLDNFNDFYDPAEKRANVAEVTATAARCGREFSCLAGDIRDPAAVSAWLGAGPVDAVIHLAAMAGVRPSLERPDLYVSVNVDGTALLLEAARKAGVRRFVFASSSSVYGNCPVAPFSESMSVDAPISPYAATKKAGELLCHTWHHLYGMNIACLRFFTVYGPRQRPDLAIRKFCEHLLAGQDIELYGDGSTSRDYTFIDDIVSGVTAALAWTDSAQRRFEVFNLGNSQPVPLSELVSAIEHATGQSARVARKPMQPGDVERTSADVSKAARVLDYRPAWTIERGIAAMAAWVQQRR